MNPSAKNSAYRERRRRATHRPCDLCQAEEGFIWRCRCGFAICQECMEENFWGLSCNGITWNCPDCGAQNGLGNQ